MLVLRLAVGAVADVGVVAAHGERGVHAAVEQRVVPDELEAVAGDVAGACFARGDGGGRDRSERGARLLHEGGLLALAELPGRAVGQRGAGQDGADHDQREGQREGDAHGGHT